MLMSLQHFRPISSIRNDWVALDGGRTIFEHSPRLAQAIMENNRGDLLSESRIVFNWPRTFIAVGLRSEDYTGHAPTRCVDPVTGHQTGNVLHEFRAHSPKRKPSRIQFLQSGPREVLGQQGDVFVSRQMVTLLYAKLLWNYSGQVTRRLKDKVDTLLSVEDVKALIGTCKYSADRLRCSKNLLTRLEGEHDFFELQYVKGSS